MESKEPPALALRGLKVSTFPLFLQETVTGAVMSGMLLGLGGLGKWAQKYLGERNAYKYTRWAQFVTSEINGVK